MKITELKKEARAKLIGKWPLVVGINFLHLIITFVLAYTAEKSQDLISLILVIFSSILTIPLSYGLSASMLKISRNEEVELTDFITIGFKNFKRAFFLSLSIFIRLLIPTILIVISVSLFIFCAFSGYASLNIFVPLILSIVSIIWIMYISLSLTLTTYILIDNENATSKDAIKTSKELMNGNKLKFIVLVFSFFGWLLLIGFLSGVVQAFSETLGSIISLGLSLLLTPYITFTEINFYEYLANVSVVEAKSEIVVEEIEVKSEDEKTSSEQ